LRNDGLFRELSVPAQRHHCPAAEDIFDRMKYSAIATDYDGTLAHDGVVHPETRVALQRARTGGVRLLLVTGRQLDDLARTFPDVGLFDRIVAENGAVLFDPATALTSVVASAPPPALLELLEQRGVPFASGHSIVATVEPHADALRRALDELDLGWTLIFNKHSVMALPAGISKATGVRRALQDLGLDAQRTIAIGDAENDEPLLRACGLAVAVDNAVPALKQVADLTTRGARGDGVIEVVDRLLSGNLERPRDEQRP
jgi:hydroxymethylpyrimidine pyrophosphatase-like HAD family hydrolase